jgi:uncharacterized protein
MGRLLVLIAIVLAIGWLLRRALRPPVSASRSSPEKAPAEELVRCAHCDVLLPRGEARMAAGALYCGDEHARRGPGR